MQSLRKLRWSHAVFAAVLAIACTDTYLHDPRRVDSAPADPALAIEGKFCTPATNEVGRPLKNGLRVDAPPETARPHGAARGKRGPR